MAKKKREVKVDFSTPEDKKKAEKITKLVMEGKLTSEDIKNKSKPLWEKIVDNFRQGTVTFTVEVPEDMAEEVNIDIPHNLVLTTDYDKAVPIMSAKCEKYPTEANKKTLEELKKRVQSYKDRHEVDNLFD